MDVNYIQQSGFIVDGLYTCQQPRTDELNDRIFSRIHSDNQLRPNYDPRPVSTKYSVFPIIECKTPIKTELKQYGDYEINRNFTSITTNGPPMEFINNIDKESALRNQGIAKQKNNDMGIFVPSSSGDLYTVPVAYGRSETQTHTRLFDTPTFTTNRRIKNTENTVIGSNNFNNDTRSQLKNM